MTDQTNHLKLPKLSFLGAHLPMVILPSRGMKKRNEPNVGHLSLPKGQASLLDFKYKNTKQSQLVRPDQEKTKRTQLADSYELF